MEQRTFCTRLQSKTISSATISQNGLHQTPDIKTMRTILLISILSAVANLTLQGQNKMFPDKEMKAIHNVIQQYSLARETRDTLMLKNILTDDVDQLVSTGEWRNGIAASVRGMLNSSANSPGTRTLTIEKLRSVGQGAAIVDCKYEIQNPNNSIRRMWSTFVLVSDKGEWKISAIRNMLPTSP